MADNEPLSILNNGAPILCADCGYSPASYDILVQHICLHHAPDSLSQYLALKSDSETDVHTEHPNAGIRVANERLPNTLEAFKEDGNWEKHLNNPAWPFANLEEVEMARFLNERLPLAAIDEFLKLQWVRLSLHQVMIC